MNNPNVVVVLPAYNAEKTLRQTINDIPKQYLINIILVDDGSTDATLEVARDLGLDYFAHERNLGYGANQKTCYKLALERGADIIVMLHPDYQYDPKLISYFVDFIHNGYFDVMLGSRIRSRREALAGGMPLYKYIANRILSLLENIISGQNLSEWHSGMRAYRRAVLEKINFLGNSNDFVFDTQMLFKIIENDFKIGEIPVAVRYLADSSSINLKRSVKYGLATVWESFKHLSRRVKNIKK